MNIAMVSEHASPLAVLGGADAGGQNVHVAELSAALVRAGHRITVFTRRDDPRLPARVLMPSGVAVAHVDAGPARAIAKDDLLPHMPAFAQGLARAFGRLAPDLVHAHFWMSARAALEAAKPLGIPVVHTFHALGSEKRRMQGAADTSPLERLDEELRIAHDADRIIATSSSEIFELCRLGADPRRLKIVPCGVDVALFDRVDPPYVLSRRQAHRIVTLSRLVERKGVGDVIRALRDVPDAELAIAGGPALAELGGDREAQRLLALARATGVADRVTFLGRVGRTEIPALLRSADVVVCAAWYEPFGIVPLEAMAAGVPVVATAVGGQNDTVIDRFTGLHVPPRDPRALAAALRELLADPAMRARLGAAGRARIEGRFTWDRIAAESLKVYRGIGRASDAVSHTA
ncbi:MAG: glycosyltransferase family 1 protein [Vulcanimicrobiaceae bacterium]